MVLDLLVSSVYQVLESHSNQVDNLDYNQLVEVLGYLEHIFEVGKELMQLDDSYDDDVDHTLVSVVGKVNWKVILIQSVELGFVLEATVE